MMMNNPDDNHNPNQGDHNNRPIGPNESLDRKITSVAAGSDDIGPNDVLCGRSKSSFNHVGNRRFRAIVTGSLDEYNHASGKWGKSLVAGKLVGMITSEGGRFLKQRKGNDEDWFELSNQEAKAKVSHAIRDAIAAKDRAKNIREAGGSGSTPVKRLAAAKNQEPPGRHFGGNRGHQRLGNSSSSIRQSMMAGQQRLLAQNLSLTSMSQPFLAMEGTQPFGTAGNAMNLLQDPLLVPPLNTPPFGDGAGAGLGFVGMGGGAGLSYQQHPGQLLLQQHHRRLSHQPSMEAPQGVPTQTLRRNTMPHLSQSSLAELSSYGDHQVPDVTGSSMQATGGFSPQSHMNTMPGAVGLRPSLQDRLQAPHSPAGTTRPGVARAPRQVEESKQGEGKATASSSSGSQAEPGGDCEFLSLIDNVLGPMDSPKRPKDKRKSL